MGCPKELELDEMNDLKKFIGWNVGFSTKASKQTRKMPRKVLDNLTLLIKDIEETGPIQKEWPHFSALEKGKQIPSDAYHCHIKSGRPTFVVCWQIRDKKNQIIEIFYVGTHENSPY
jgi:hypothetical protein